jgi:hypothetical protein
MPPGQKTHRWLRASGISGLDFLKPNNDMKFIYLFLIPLVLIGCTNPNRKASYKDEFEAVKVDQVVGNNIALRLFEKTIVCLNPRREIRVPAVATNQVVTSRTNYSVQMITNQIVMIVTNLNHSYSTNQLPPPPPPVVVAPVEGQTNAIADGSTTTTNSEPAVASNVSPPPVTNVVVSSSQNVSTSKAPSQHSTVEIAQIQTSQQIVVVTNNLSIATTENRTVSAETNWTVNFVTNLMVAFQTNQQVAIPEGPVSEYFLSVELTQPADFVLAQGESLVLVVDGFRYGFTTTNTPSFFLAKKGFSSYLFKASHQALTSIANAKEVRFRLRGTTTSIERRMSQSSRNGFKKFLARAMKEEKIAGIAALPIPELAAQ